MVTPKKSNVFVDPVIEVVTNSLTILTELPAIGIPVKLYKAAVGVRDTIFFNKLKRFFEELDSITEEKRIEFWSTYEDNQEEKQKLGEQIIIYLDRQDSLDKAALLAKAFCAHIQGEIQKSDFFDLAIIIDSLKIHHLEGIVSIITLAGTGSSFRDITVGKEWKVLIPEMIAQGLLDSEDKLEVVEDSNRKQQTIIKRKYRSTVLAEHLLKYVVSELAQDVSVKVAAYHKRWNDMWDQHK